MLPYLQVKCHSIENSYFFSINQCNQTPLEECARITQKRETPHW